MNNLRVRDERGRLGLSSVTEGGEDWMIWTTEIYEECVLRGHDYPGPLNISGFRAALDHAFDPIPNMEAVLAKYLVSPSKGYLLKFGDPHWLKRSFETGSFRIAPASFYDSTAHNHARRDAELSRTLIPNPRDPRIPEFLSSRGITGPLGKALSTIEIDAKTDYYLASFSAAYSARLFGDFGASGCLVIHDPAIFLDRFAAAVNAHLLNHAYHVGLVSYFDPVRVDPALIDVRFFKPFRHAYQNEMRLTWTPPTLLGLLRSFEVQLGPICDCAELVNIGS